ncbi:ATP-binding protein [Actinoplanes sp. CA-131856]
MTNHVLLLYHDIDDLSDRLSRTAPFDGRVIVACRPQNRDAIDRALHGRPVQRAEQPDIHTRPVAALALYRRLGRQSGTEVTIIAEPQTGSTEQSEARAATAEAACDLAGLGENVHLICAYPAASPEALLTNLIRTHRELLTPHGRQPSPDYTDPVATLRTLAPAPPPPPGAPPTLRIAGSTSIKDLGAIRHDLTTHLAGLPTLIRTDFVAAVNELVTNGHLHGAPPLDLRLWITGDSVECRVTDHGPGRPDPMAGYLPTPGSGRSGTGLWLARQLCDDIDMWREKGIFTVRAATAISTDRNRHHAGAVARAETAQTRAKNAQNNAELVARRVRMASWR